MTAAQPGKRRRAHGEGAVWQRSDGRWVGQLDLGWVEGKRRRRAVVGRTKAEASDKLRTLKNERDRGVNLTARRLTVSEWLDEWLTRVKPAAGLRATTMERYRQVVERHLRPALGKVRLDRLSPMQVQAFLDGVEAAPGTVVKIHGVLRSALSDAERLDLVGRNVAKAARVSGQGHRQRRVLTPAEARGLLRSMAGERLEPLFTVALVLGLRRGELVGLRWADVDLDERTLYVRQSIVRVGAELRVQAPKTYRSVRPLRLPGAAVEALQRQRAAQAAERLRAGPDWQDLGLVFTSSVGTPLDPRNVTREFARLRSRAGLGWVRLHDLRHACATFLLAEGIEPRTVMDVLGHSTTRLLDVYGHALPERLDAAADVMDGLLGGSLGAS
jgi:integrase